MSPKKSKLAAIEAVVCRDVGRKTQALIDASLGELADAALALSEAKSVGLITGFYVPRGDRRGSSRRCRRARRSPRHTPCGGGLACGRGYACRRHRALRSQSRRTSAQ